MDNNIAIIIFKLYQDYTNFHLTSNEGNIWNRLSHWILCQYRAYFEEHCREYKEALRGDHNPGDLTESEDDMTSHPILLNMVETPIESFHMIFR